MLKNQLFFSFIFIFALCCLFPTITLAKSNNDASYNLDQFLETELTKAHVPASSILIFDSNNTLFSKQYGEGITENSPFIIGSMSKSFVAVSVMKLVEKGLLDLDAPITNYLPNLKFNTSDIHVIDLLNHTSGIGTYQNSELICKVNQNKVFEYSNANYNLLGDIIESITSQSYKSYLSENIFEPLHFQNSFTSLEEAKSNGLVPGHQNLFGIAIKYEIASSYSNPNSWIQLPSGLVISSTSDMRNYLQFFMHQGYYKGKQIISSESVYSILQDGKYTIGDPATSGFFSDEAIYSKGWITKKVNNTKLHYHIGKVANYTSLMAIILDKDQGIVMLTNIGDIFASTSMIEHIGENLVALIIGNTSTPIENHEYFTNHLLINFFFIIVIYLCSIPLIRINHWKKVIAARKKYLIMKLVSIHLLLPLFIMAIFYLIFGATLWYVLEFSLDVTFVVFLCITILILTGLIKILYIIKIKRGIS